MNNSKRIDFTSLDISNSFKASLGNSLVARQGGTAGTGDNTRLETDKSLEAGIHFYPSNGVSRLEELSAEDDDEFQEHEFMTYQLDPAIIFTKAIDTLGRKLAPEQNITLFALRLAMLEKSASGVGKLAFIWASAVILGGFASDIQPSDFVVVTTILLTEGARIFSRSRQLEWQRITAKTTGETKFGEVSRKKIEKIKEHHPQKLAAASVKRFFTSIKHANTLYPVGSDASKDSHEQEVESDKSPLAVHIEKQGSGDTSATLRQFESGEGRRDDLGGSFRSTKSGKSQTSRPASPKQSAGKLQRNWFGSFNPRDINRTWSVHVVPLVPGAKQLLSAHSVSIFLYWLQLASAMVSIVLSCWRLSHGNYNPPGVDVSPPNLVWSVNLFYALALIEATLFLVERAYWEWKINHRRLLVDVNNKAELGAENQDLMKRFFYEVYSKCVVGSVFDGLEMDLVTYSIALLVSDSSSEQLGGSKVLRKIVEREDGFAVDALRRIGTSPGIIERLVEMLSWRSQHQEEIRKEVAALLCRVVRYSKNCFRIASVPGSMDGIVSLLKMQERDPAGREEIDVTGDTMTLRLNGLRILIEIAKDHANCATIGQTRGLLPILVTFIEVKDVVRFKNIEQGPELKVFRKSLQLLAMLGAARNMSGHILRPMIARVVSALANLRDILEYGISEPQLKWLALELVTNLAMDDNIRQVIGSTGGMIRQLFILYARQINDSGSEQSGHSPPDARKRQERIVSKKAGDALNLLALQNAQNCRRLLDLKDVETSENVFTKTMIESLSESRDHGICAAKILRSVLEYANDGEAAEIAKCSYRVMLHVLEGTYRMQEASLGLAARVLPRLDTGNFKKILANFNKQVLSQLLVRNLQPLPPATNKFPRLRRHSTELIIVLLNRDTHFVHEFVMENLELHLERTMDTISEVENFCIFEGAEGLARHAISMEDLIKKALLEFRVQSLRQESQPSSRHPLVQDRL